MRRPAGGILFIQLFHTNLPLDLRPCGLSSSLHHSDIKAKDLQPALRSIIRMAAASQGRPSVDLRAPIDDRPPLAKAFNAPWTNGGPAPGSWGSWGGYAENSGAGVDLLVQHPSAVEDTTQHRFAAVAPPMDVRTGSPDSESGPSLSLVQPLDLAIDDVDDHGEGCGGGGCVANDSGGDIWAMDIDSPSADDIGAVLRALDCSPRTSKALGSRGTVVSFGDVLRGSGSLVEQSNSENQRGPQLGLGGMMILKGTAVGPPQGDHDIPTTADRTLRTSKALKAAPAAAAAAATVEGWRDTFSGWSATAAREALRGRCPHAAETSSGEDMDASDLQGGARDPNRRLTFGTFVL